MEIRPVTLSWVPERQIRAVLAVPRSTTMDAILVLGHGANNDMDQPLIAGLHEGLARQGLDGALQFSLRRRGAQKAGPR